MEIASTFEWLDQWHSFMSLVRLPGVTGGSLTRRQKRSLCCFLVEVPRHINEQVPVYF